MNETLQQYERSVEGFDRRFHAIGADQWHLRTPCTDWDVRTLANHVLVEQLWVLPLLNGETVEEVGDRYAGDELGQKPAATWDVVAKEARMGFAAVSFDRMVHLSYGDVPVEAYCRELTTDLLIHTWDLARGIGADDKLDPELVDVVYRRTLPDVTQLHASGLFDAPVPVPDGADQQTKLLGLFGRRA